jgi:hypothetical protein
MEGTRYFCQNSEFTLLDRVPKNTRVSNFMKICAVGVELLHAHGRTKLRDGFRNFANAPKNRCTDTSRLPFHNVIFLQDIQLSSRTHNANIFHHFCHVCSEKLARL